jgi:BirA family biotin operon repressor/biotin-[acetyl-CoA-carboxylase] ligase
MCFKLNQTTHYLNIIKSCTMTHKIIKFETIESTNSYAYDLLKRETPPEGTIIWATEQTHGRGRHNNTWESEKGKNLTISLILYPAFINTEEQFLLSKAISLGIFDYLNEYVNNVTIKWPNDIYVNNDKIAGILIENSICGNRFDHSIVGIGLNVNQVHFTSNAPNPASMKLQLGRDIDLDTCLHELTETIDIRYDMLRNKKFGRINTDYLSHLYLYKIFTSYKSKQDEFEARIIDVENNGLIVIETSNKKIMRFSFNEVFYT